MFRFLPIFLSTLAFGAEVHTLTLKQAVDRALQQNSEITLARLDEQKAAAGVKLARDPFSMHIGAGSGLAYSNGFPLSIEGSAPSAFQAKASQFLYNRPQSFLVAQARENARGATFATSAKRDEIAFRTTSLYLDADRAARLSTTAAKQVESMTKVAEAVRGRVQEGRELPIESTRAKVDLLRAQQRVDALDADRDFAERSLAMVLGYGPGDRVQTVGDDRVPPETPDSEQAAVATALASSKDLRRLESALLAKGLEIKSQQASRLPRVDLVAQYAFFTKYSHYDEYFQKFQRHNGQLGASIQIPFLPGSGVGAAISQTEADAAHLRTEMNAMRHRIILDVHQSYLEIRKAEGSRDLAKAELDLAREQLSVVLAQTQEGRAAIRQVEEARFAENEKWIAFYDAQFAAERAKFNLLRQTGELVASLK